MRVLLLLSTTVVFAQNFPPQQQLQPSPPPRHLFGGLFKGDIRQQPKKQATPEKKQEPIIKRTIIPPNYVYALSNEKGTRYTPDPKYTTMLHEYSKYVISHPTGIRKEWRELTSDEQDKFFNGLRLVKESGFYNYLAYLHTYHAPWTHGNPNFLPWHRTFNSVFERSMQVVLKDDNYYIPYWQINLDSQSPEKSPLLTNNKFGDNGWKTVINEKGDKTFTQDLTKQDMLDSPFIASLAKSTMFKNWMTNEGVPLSRGGNKTLSAFYSPEQLVLVLKQDNYRDFQDYLSVYHGVVHKSLSGNFQTMGSCDDPLFFLLHTFIDKIWSDWQIKNNDYIYLPTEMNVDDELLPFMGERGPITNRQVIENLKCKYTVGLTVDISSIKLPEVRSNRLMKRGDLLPCPTDRKNLYLLRDVSSLTNDEMWMKMNNIDKERTSSIEDAFRNVHLRLNEAIKKGEYVSAVSLASMKRGILITAIKVWRRWESFANCVMHPKWCSRARKRKKMFERQRESEARFQEQ